MLIKVRDKTDSLFVKDALDIDYDMSIEEKNGKYFVRINSEYRYAQNMNNKYPNHFIKTPCTVICYLKTP